MKKRRNGYLIYAVAISLILMALFYESFQPRSIETVTIVSGVGLEKGQDGKVKMSVQVIKPEKNESGSSTSSCITITGEADSISAASEKIILKTGSVLFWAHCAVIILQEDFAAEEDVMPYLDMFFRSMSFRNTSSVLLSKESPEDILNSATVFEMVTSFGIQKMLDDQDYDSNSVYTSLKFFTEKYYMPCHSVVVSGISIMEVGEYGGGSKEGDSTGGDSKNESGVKTLQLSPCAVLERGKFKGYLTDEELNGYKWLSQTMKAKLVTIDAKLKSENNQDNTLGVSIFGAKSKVKAAYEDGKYILRVNVKAKAEIISLENEIQVNDISKEKLEKRSSEFEEIIENNIKEEIIATWNKMIETDCDYCSIRDTFYSKFRKAWKNSAPETCSEMLKQIELDCNIDVSIISGGLNKRYFVG